jgi:hypothetical protein
MLASGRSPAHTGAESVWAHITLLLRQLNIREIQSQCTQHTAHSKATVFALLNHMHCTLHNKLYLVESLCLVYAPHCASGGGSEGGVGGGGVNALLHLLKVLVRRSAQCRYRLPPHTTHRTETRTRMYIRVIEWE